MVARHAVTAEELLQMPDTGQRMELIDGELISMPPATAEHSSVGAEIVFLIRRFVGDRKLGAVFNSDTGYRLSEIPDTVLSPDASYVSAQRLPSRKEWRRFFSFAPDLAFEVLSPSNSAREMAEKTRRYLEAGSVMVVIVDPGTESIDVFTSHGSVSHLSLSDDLDLNAVLPGLSVPVASFFSQLSDFE